MEVRDAIEIIRDLAEQNALDPERCDTELIDEAKRQEEAFETLQIFLSTVGV